MLGSCNVLAFTSKVLLLQHAWAKWVMMQQENRQGRQTVQQQMGSGQDCIEASSMLA